LAHHQQQQHPPPQTIGAIENGLKFIRIHSPGLHPSGGNGAVHQKDLMGTSPLANFLNSSNLVGGNRVVPNATDVSDLESRQHQQQQTMQPLHLLLKRAESHQPTTNTLNNGNMVQNKPALMPPTMFLSSSSQASKLTSTTTTTNITQLLKSSVPAPGDGILTRNMQDNNKVESSFSSLVASATTSTFNNNNRPEPLTQNQFIQAMNHLIQNDPEFIKKLHEAYLSAYLKSFTELL
jgi:hypothetical protein